MEDFMGFLKWLDGLLSSSVKNRQNFLTSLLAVLTAASLLFTSAKQFFEQQSENAKNLSALSVTLHLALIVVAIAFFMRNFRVHVRYSDPKILRQIRVFHVSWIGICIVWFCFYLARAMNEWQFVVPSTMEEGAWPNLINRLTTPFYVALFLVLSGRWNLREAPATLAATAVFLAILTVNDFGHHEKRDQAARTIIAKQEQFLPILHERGMPKHQVSVAKGSDEARRAADNEPSSHKLDIRDIINPLTQDRIRVLPPMLVEEYTRRGQSTPKPTTPPVTLPTTSNSENAPGMTHGNASPTVSVTPPPTPPDINVNEYADAISRHKQHRQAISTIQIVGGMFECLILVMVAGRLDTTPIKFHLAFTLALYCYGPLQILFSLVSDSGNVPVNLVLLLAMLLKALVIFFMIYLLESGALGAFFLSEQFNDHEMNFHWPSGNEFNNDQHIPIWGGHSSSKQLLAGPSASRPD
jgi:hypothetical protein